MHSAAFVPSYHPQSASQKLAGASFSVAVVASVGLLLWGLKPYVASLPTSIGTFTPLPDVVKPPIPDDPEPVLPPTTPIDSTALILDPNIVIDDFFPIAQVKSNTPSEGTPLTGTDVPPVTPPPVRPVQPETKPVNKVNAGECPNFASVGATASDDWEKLAEREGLEKGSVSVLFTIAADGSVKDIKPEKSTHPGLTRLAVKAVSHLRCTAQGQDVTKRFAVSFSID